MENIGCRGSTQRRRNKKNSSYTYAPTMSVSSPPPPPPQYRYSKLCLIVYSTVCAGFIFTRHLSMSLNSVLWRILSDYLNLRGFLQTFYKQREWKVLCYEHVLSGWTFKSCFPSRIRSVLDDTFVLLILILAAFYWTLTPGGSREFVSSFDSYENLWCLAKRPLWL